MSDFRSKLERSSFGTRGAIEARKSVSQERADQVLRRSRSGSEKTSGRSEGKRGSGTL